MNTYEAIYRRKSVRRYRQDRIPEEMLEEFQEYVKLIPGIIPGIQTELQIEEIKGAKYNVMNTVPACRIKLYSEEKERYLINAGYLMEMLSLYMTTRGVGSCYQGKYTFRKEELNGRKLVLAMHAGFPQDSHLRESYKFHRLDLKQLCVEKEPLRPWMREILETARLAPSSLNSQPWRFLVSNGRIHIFCRKEKNESKRVLTELNLGIMLAHIMTAAEEMWLSADLIRLENISQKEFKQFDYVLSADFNR